MLIHMSVVQEIWQEFEDWLFSPDCERKDAKTAKQHMAQVKKVLSIVGEGICLQSLSGLHTANVT